MYHELGVCKTLFPWIPLKKNKQEKNEKKNNK